jgi:cytochrome oxidase Cu insertion factor (SCO1/SenC/PrrC family)/thiol-disulfide isomerase/thioredoxin
MTDKRAKLGLRVWLAAATVLAAALAIGLLSHSSRSPRAGLASNPYLDPGTPLSGRAPDFALTDQFGHRVTLSSFRGRAVLLAFNDSECTTICPLTTAAMVEAKALLGSAGSSVALLGVDANPDATSIADVRSYSQAHGMLHQWQFLTGGKAQLKRVWAAYHIDVAIEQDQIDHTPALFLIDPNGRLRKLYVTQQAYSAVGQLGQLLAQDAAAVLPGHPRPRALRSYAQIPTLGPGTPVTLPRAGGGSVALGRPGTPQLLFFFATWVTETTDVRSQLDAVDRYRAAASRAGLPAPIAVDEASVEPSPTAVTRFLRALSRAPGFPVAIDASGRVADGYQVQDQPWFVLTSSTGRILWYWDASTQGPLSAAQLTRHVRAALSKAARVTVPSDASVPRALAGSPAPLAALHRQAGQLLESAPALAARLRSLRGYPVVLNAWGSWCGPCVAEFPLFASASVRYGRSVAFLGVDTNDFPGPARAFLAKHPISYPSYQSQSSQLNAIIPQGLIGTPTTIFFNRAGKIVYTHTGQYRSQGSLDEDIAQYAAG